MPPRSVLALILGFAGAACAGSATPDPETRAELVGTYTWYNSDPGFGGLSALDYDPETGNIIAVADRGRLVIAKLERAEGSVVDVSDLRITPLLDPGANPVVEGFADSEGLEVMPDGSLLISFENEARVWRYPRSDGPAEPLPTLPAFETFGVNSSFEALAVAPDGAILTLPERSGRMDAPFPVFRYRGGAWDQPFTLPRRGEHVPTGADFGPDGRFYLLERRFLGILGFSTRVRSFAYDATGFSDERTVVVTLAGRHDNLEGISVWRDDAGSIRILMVSDDNNFALQRTELVEYRLTE